MKLTYLKPRRVMQSVLLQVPRTKLAKMINLRLLLIFLVITCAMLLIFYSFLYPGLTTALIKPYNQSGLILHTPGCSIPKLDPYDHSVRNIIVHRQPYTCSGMPVFIITHPNATLTLNETVLNISYKALPKDVSCSYVAYHREPESSANVGENRVPVNDTEKTLRFGVPLGEEFIKVKCGFKEGKKNFTQYIPLVPIKPHVEEKDKMELDTSNFLNIVLIGIDSVSKLNFLRHLKKTHEFLTNNLSAFDMKGYTKVGENTFPNLVPMLTGHFIEHYYNETLRHMFFDHLDFIWKNYSSNGYKTFYAEDNPYFGTFNYLKKGFKYPPTDYYFRPLALVMENSKLKKKSKRYCYGSQLEIDIFYGYLKDYLETMKNKLSFSFTMVSTLTHDDINVAGYADEPTYNLLKHLESHGVMNRSLVVIFSDHGIRFGKIRETYIGKFEERMPFMYLTMPKWFLEKYKTAARNLKTNQNRLITLFDLHATLEHLLTLPNLMTEDIESVTTGNGLSLLGDIFEHRTCEMANILPHWCPCHTYQYISPNDKFAMKAAEAIVEDINKQLKPFKHRCNHLRISEITDARMAQVNDIVLRYIEHKDDVFDTNVEYAEKGNVQSDFLITFRAEPGGGMFEGTVRYDTGDKNLTVLGVSRINAYGTQSWCVDIQSMKKFCYCR